MTRTSLEAEETSLSETSEGAIVFIDGACNLCNHAVQFVIDHESAPTLSFVSLQSPVARDLLGRVFAEREIDAIVRGATGSGDPDSVVVIDGDTGLTHSDAALYVAGHLQMPYRWLSALRVVPRGVRDTVYRWIARNRYRFFGKSEVCRIPTPALRARFLDAVPAETPDRIVLTG